MVENREDHGSSAGRRQGREGDLVPPQHRLVEEIRADQAWLGPKLDVTMPSAAMLRIAARLDGELALQAQHATPQRVRAWWVSSISAAAAAVAVAAIMLLTWVHSPQPTQVAKSFPTEPPVAYTPGVQPDPEMEAINVQVASLMDELDEPADSTVSPGVVGQDIGSMMADIIPTDLETNGGS